MSNVLGTDIYRPFSMRSRSERSVGIVYFNTIKSMSVSSLNSINCICVFTNPVAFLVPPINVTLLLYDALIDASIPQVSQYALN